MIESAFFKLRCHAKRISPLLVAARLFSLYKERNFEQYAELPPRWYFCSYAER